MQRPFTHRATLGALLCAGVILCAPKGWSQAPVEPVSCLVYTPEDIAAVRKAVAVDPVMRAAADEFLRRSERWVKMSGRQIEDLMPAPDAEYAAGYAGDPRTNGAWSRWGRDGDVCSLEHPGEVKSPYTGDVYAVQKPGEPYYDDGQGWVRPEDGKKFYFKGVWNAYVIRAFHDALDALSVSYMLTGDPRYSERALFLFDQMATLRARRPATLTDACIDFPAPVRPGAKFGFFTYDGNQGNDRMYASALAFDLVGRSASAAPPSPGNPALSTFENIRQNYFFVCERELVDGGRSLQNHAVTAYVSMTAQALLFGYAADVRKGLEACGGFLDNTIDRDGEYYEISASYATLGREYGGRLLNLFSHYRPDRYPDPKAFPDPGKDADKLAFGRNPVWFNTAVRSMYTLSTLSRRPQYGDSAADRYAPTGKSFDAGLYPGYAPEARHKMTFLKLFDYQTDNPEWKRVCGLLYARIPARARNDGKAMVAGILEYGPSQWLTPAGADGVLPRELEETDSTVAGQKRIAILRSGEGANQRALFIRGGSTAAHAHNDQMAVSYYAQGMSLTGATGYYLWGTPYHRGYGTRSVAHATVVVDEDLPPSEFMAFRPPARMTGYLPFGPAQMVEMSDPELWPQSHLAEYRRQDWLIDVSDSEAYFVDAFWVHGGKTHDYVWQAPFVDPSHDTDLSMAGVVPKPFPGVWSLAALGGRYGAEIFNQPGKSWGERLETGTETMRPVGLPGERLPNNRWNPAPGNGYGFIWDVKGDQTDKDWSATWLLHDHKHFTKLTMVDSGRQMVLTGKAPSLQKDHFFNPVVARREAADGTPLQSRFLAVTQVSGDREQWPLKEIASLPGTGPDDVGMVATHGDGTRDTLLAAGPGRDEVELASAKLHGARGFIRQDPSGAVSEIVLNEGTSLEAAGVSLRLPAADWKATVTKVSGHQIALDGALPGDDTLKAQAAIFSSPTTAAVPYASNEFFTVEKAETNPDGGSLLQFENESVVAARIKVATADYPSGAVTTEWPDELACQMPKVWVPDEQYQTRVFDGHLIRQEESPRKNTVVTNYLDANTFLVGDPYVMEEGKTYDIMAVQPMDQLRIPSFAILKRLDAGRWEVRANMDTAIAFADQSASWMLRGGGSADVPLPRDAQGYLQIPVSSLKAGKGMLISADSGDR